MNNHFTRYAIENLHTFFFLQIPGKRVFIKIYEQFLIDGDQNKRLVQFLFVSEKKMCDLLIKFIETLTQMNLTL